MIKRYIHQSIAQRLQEAKKIIVLYGARQVGKTTLIKSLLKDMPGKHLVINADRQEYIDVLTSRNLSLLAGLVSGYDVLVIDEAQRVPDIGINLKILHDELPNLSIIVSGSSSLSLANRIKEPLTGRTWTYKLYPISTLEWQQDQSANNQEIKFKLEEWLRFGMYPELMSIKNYNEKKEYLNDITEAYLYKDILALAKIKYPEKLRQLLRLLALQIGDLVSIHELAIQLQINRDTVINYIDLLEKSFVIFRLSGFSKNLRKEVTSMDKIYFYDLGIRNAIIGHFSELDSRIDIGHLWENYILSERMKKLEYHKIYNNRFFWRTHSGAELDYVEEMDGHLNGYEIKWRNKKARKPKTWLATYESATFKLINQENFCDFIT